MNRFIFDCDAKVMLIFYSANFSRKKMKLFFKNIPKKAKNRLIYAPNQSEQEVSRTEYTLTKS